jgi:hypothetical protein
MVHFVWARLVRALTLCRDEVKSYENLKESFTFPQLP